MKIAFSTLGCPYWSFEDIYATAADLGFDGVELRGIGNEIYVPRAKAFSDERIEATKKKFADGFVKIPMPTSGACTGKGDMAAAVRESSEYIDLAAKLSVPYIRVMITDLPNPTDDADFEAAVSCYGEICEYGKSAGVMPLIETNSILASSDKMKELMESVNSTNKGVLWDIHHPIRYYGEKPQYTYDNLKDYVRHVHVKDSVIVDGKLEYRMMGYGDMPIFDTLSMLKTAGFDGYVSLEWVKRWYPELSEPGIVFAHYITYMKYLLQQI
jgi:fatty-acyl-CoA synthase